jgi:hypothetical protein
MPQKPKCPKCKSSKAVIPIIYGMPPPDIEEKARKRKLVIGGCVFGEGVPTWHCKACNHWWHGKPYPQPELFD